MRTARINPTIAKRPSPRMMKMAARASPRRTGARQRGMVRSLARVPLVNRSDLSYRRRRGAAPTRSAQTRSHHAGRRSHHAGRAAHWTAEPGAAGEPQVRRLESLADRPPELFERALFGRAVRDPPLDDHQPAAGVNARRLRVLGQGLNDVLGLFAGRAAVAATRAEPAPLLILLWVEGVFQAAGLAAFAAVDIFVRLFERVRQLPPHALGRLDVRAQDGARVQEVV